MKSKQSVTKSLGKGNTAQDVRVNSVKRKPQVKRDSTKTPQITIDAEPETPQVQLPAVLLPDPKGRDDKAIPFAEREHIKLLYDAIGLKTSDIARVKEVLLDALGATAAKDITVSLGQNAGSEVQRVQEDLANYDVRLEAAEKLLKLADLYPKKKENSVAITGSNVVINPRFIKKKK